MQVLTLPNALFSCFQFSISAPLGKLFFNYLSLAFKFHINSTAGAHPCELLLLMSAKEGDTPKVEELLAAGADPACKDKDGKTPLDLCDKDEVKELLQAALAKSS